MRVGILGGGVIARLFLEHARRGEMGDAKVVALAGRGENSRGKTLAREFDVPFVVGAARLIEARPEVVIEAASHDAVRQCAEELLSNGIALVVLSGGALCDDGLRARLEHAAAKHGVLLYVPSGGIVGQHQEADLVQVGLIARDAHDARDLERVVVRGAGRGGEDGGFGPIDGPGEKDLEAIYRERGRHAS